VRNCAADGLSELLNFAAIVSESTDSVGIASELRSDLELCAARACIQRGALDQAADLLLPAASRTSARRRREVADQLLLVASAWTQSPGDPARLSRAGNLLRAAVELDPARALSSLAQYLVRQERLDEAIACWQEAIRANPSEVSHYLNLARMYERLSQPEAALTTYMTLIDAAPSSKTFLVVAESLQALAPSLPAASPTRTLRLALLSNSTLDHLHSYLQVECYRAGLRPEFYQGRFDQYAQDILDPNSALYTFGPEVLILAVHPSRLFPRLHDYPFDMSVAERRADIEAGLSTLRRLLDAYTQRSSSLVLLHNMTIPQHPAMGILDCRDELGQTAIFSEINARLAEMVRSHYTNVFIVDEERLQARCGKERATDPRLWHIAKIGWSEVLLPGLAKEYLRYIKPLKGLSRKCIIVDLDNTLWGGVIGEDGLAGIQLGPDAPGSAFVDFQRELRKLLRRGVLLAICSKNNGDDVRLAFEEHPSMVLSADDFAARRINWEPKVKNIRDIAEELNIGLDSLVFIDDNPVERAAVRSELPGVLTPELPRDPVLYRTALLDLNAFDALAVTAEDRRRNELYAAERARRTFEAAHETSGSLEEFLAAMAIVVEIEPADAHTLPRISQLLNKTNQFNLTTYRRSHSELEAMQGEGCLIYGARVTDRFGDNGLVGVIIAVPRTAMLWEIDTLLLSCRVMGRSIESALISFVANQARRHGGVTLRGCYRPTTKNSPVKDCYRTHGFALTERRPDGTEYWDLDLRRGELSIPHWLLVRTGASRFVIV
jgi:FkbH-like protein